MRSVAHVDKPGLSLDPGLLHTGNNSGYQAIGLAVLLGAAKVLLLGYDMSRTGGKSHHHGDHPSGLNNPNDAQLQRYATAFETLPPDLARANVSVVNCSRETALTCFPRARIEDVL